MSLVSKDKLTCPQCGDDGPFFVVKEGALREWTFRCSMCDWDSPENNYIWPKGSYIEYGFSEEVQNGTDT